MVLSKIPCLIFLSEPWLHLSDSSLTLEPLSHDYNFYLNSEDRHDDLLSLRKSRAHGGTLTLWRKDLDPYITIIHPSSSRILVMILDKPVYQTSIHVNIYLHTAGKESAFMEDLALLEATLDELAESYPDSVTYIRGDANTCIKPRLNNTRDSLFEYFLSSNTLEHVLIESIQPIIISPTTGSQTRILMFCSLPRFPVKDIQILHKRLFLQFFLARQTA